MFKGIVTYFCDKITFFLPQPLKKRLIIIRRIGIPLATANFFFQRILRIDSAYPFSKHFTSRVVCSRLLRIENDDISVLVSIALSGGCYFQAGNGIDIGKGTIIAPNVSIVSLSHEICDYDRSTSSPPIKIGRFCWIGAGSVVRHGVVLGDHTIVGANSMVADSFPEGYVVIGGVPAKIIRKLETEEAVRERRTLD